MADTDTATQNEFYPTVAAVIVHDDKVLLQRDEASGQWVAPHSHIDIHETPIDALYRHATAITGIPSQQLTALLPYVDNLTLERDESEGATQPLPFDVDVHLVGSGVHHHVESAYILVSKTDELTPQIDEPVTLEWFDADDLADLLVATRATISRALYALDKYKANPPQ